MFEQAVLNDYHCIALHMGNVFESILLRSSDKVVEPLMRRCNKDGVSEARMYLMQMLSDEFHFRHAEFFVTFLEQNAVNNPSLLTRQTNPLMLLVLTVDVLQTMHRNFRSLTLRIDAV